MVLSMTGYGQASTQFQNKKITVEVRSLNSKMFDLNLRLPSIYRSKELKLRTWIAKRLVRGKVSFGVHCQLISDAQHQHIDIAKVQAYMADLKPLASSSTDQELLALAMRMPEVMQGTHEEFTEDEWQAVTLASHDAVKNFNAFRESEGAAMTQDLSTHVDSIRANMKAIVPFETERMGKVRTRLEKSFAEAGLDGADNNRFEQELIYYLEKLDLNEEKVRLSNHCKYFVETMNSGNVVGKKLGFIAQEMGREINTIGSKANHVEIQKRVVLMKDELEKIKEQVLNVL